jgi:hypothetical protein
MVPQTLADSPARFGGWPLPTQRGREGPSQRLSLGVLIIRVVPLHSALGGASRRAVTVQSRSDWQLRLLRALGRTVPVLQPSYSMTLTAARYNLLRSCVTTGPAHPFATRCRINRRRGSQRPQRWQQRAHLHTDPLLWGPKPRRNRPPRLSETRDKFLTCRGEKETQTPLRGGERTRQRLVPLASFRSARVAAGFRHGSAGVLLCRQRPLMPNEPYGLRRSSGRVGQEPPPPALQNRSKHIRPRTRR